MAVPSRHQQPVKYTALALPTEQHLSHPLLNLQGKKNYQADLCVGAGVVLEVGQFQTI